ncbi:hypothetical protein Acr_00g0044250 [Actinidia rufa]|uniref:F-box domain-containing protein n=1 Tax=Actinidia rufa TaxID=165716 RepID=A0A7J0DKK4_9ERIC|nr:hypothetical protein Acr_00g0044250 [Actinidia rufa]
MCCKANCRRRDDDSAQKGLGIGLQPYQFQLLVAAVVRSAAASVDGGNAESFTGAFDRIPFDIFMQILKILAPKESAKLSAVCKSWKLVVSDNRLWITFFRIGLSSSVISNCVYTHTHLPAIVQRIMYLLMAVNTYLTYLTL